MEIASSLLSTYIKVYDDVIPKKCLETFLKIIEEQEFKAANVVGDPSKGEPEGVLNKKIRDVKEWPISNLNDNLTIVGWSNYFLYTFKNCIKNYAKEFNLNQLYVEIQNINVLKYGLGGHYVPHIDHGIKTPRTLSLIFLLNDDYEGGELVFKTPGFEQESIFEPKKNRLIILPSNFQYPHGVKAVTKGIRYSMVTWAL